jgi:8-oxo-dGTP pyrophosphatase MutT (NUDIX family)
MTASRFHHRPNQQVDLVDGRTIWESRAPAVAVVVVSWDPTTGAPLALVQRRGTGVDLPGLRCLVCGYLDWEESMPDAVRRELSEEAGIDLAPLEARGAAKLHEHPVLLDSAPSAHQQNVTAYFLVELEAPVPCGPQNAEPDEVEAVWWMPLDAAQIDEATWAFGHGEVLRRAASILQCGRERVEAVRALRSALRGE